MSVCNSSPSTVPGASPSIASTPEPPSSPDPGPAPEPEPPNIDLSPVDTPSNEPATEDATTPVPTTSSPEPDEVALVEPDLPTNLTRGCDSVQLDDNFDYAGLEGGKQAINFSSKDIHGDEFKLSTLLAEKPVLIVFGSFT